MKKSFVFLLCFVLFFCVFGKSNADDKNHIEIAILYDNYVSKEGLEADWGFSCIVKGTEKTILFDTGTKSEILFSNIEKLNLNPEDVEFIVISHNHGDHTGGLYSFLEKNNDVTVYLPVSAQDEYADRIKATEARAVFVNDPVEICHDVYLTGEMGDQIKEQSLILNTDKGCVVITGCSHPGIVDIIKRAKEILNKNVRLVFGGFHLLRKSENEIREIIHQFKELGVEKVGATHCTGDNVIEFFRKEYGENFVEMGVGKIIVLSD